MTTLICPDCQRENEPERIFCHGCGARLDRSGLARPTAGPEKNDQARRRIQKLFDPHRGRLRRTFFKVSKVILGAFLTAAVIQIILPVDLPPQPKQLGLPAQINFDLESAILYHRTLKYSQEQVNAYLAYILKGKARSLDEPLVSFQRALVFFDEGTCTATIERSLFGLSLCQSATYKVTVGDGKVVPVIEAGLIGRLPVHPAIMRYGDVIFADLWSVLDRERKLVAKLGAIEFHRGNVTLKAR